MNEVSKFNIRLLNYYVAAVPIRPSRP
jgi:hypothetical protein